MDMSHFVSSFFQFSFLLITGKFIIKINIFSKFFMWTIFPQIFLRNLSPQLIFLYITLFFSSYVRHMLKILHRDSSWCSWIGVTFLKNPFSWTKFGVSFEECSELFSTAMGKKCCLGYVAFETAFEFLKLVSSYLSIL